ncbi:MAG: phenylalanine--tRNA ligase subunit alpha [Bdellovibrionaceae bacterium]|nr:phenylalanine--tRNA ligase subunit alpha [Pseudobdellovibrionaceae bacterium]
MTLQAAAEFLQTLKSEASSAFEKADSRKSLYEFKVEFLGKTGKLTTIMKEMAALPKEEKPAFGKTVNEVKSALEELYSRREQELGQKEIEARMLAEEVDLSLTAGPGTAGTEHPVQKVMNEIVSILSRVGYSLKLGPAVEKDYYNFEALNLPADHPARDMQDTFFVDDTHVLRTHTSPVWSRALEKEKPPFRILGGGAVFRVDSDISHLPHFHQFEGVCVDEKVSMADLKGTITFFVREFFGPGLKTRFRPSYFPFTEPSAEVDCTCPVCRGNGCQMCKQSGWIEIGGCGLIHPKVFEKANLEYPKWQGFAWGFGVERMAIIKYGIDDIRLIPENDVRFLGQFPS